MESGGGERNCVSLFPLTHNSAVKPYHYNNVWLVKVHNFDEIRSGQMCTVVEPVLNNTSWAINKARFFRVC